MHACMHACIHEFIHTYIHTCIHAYIHTHIHTYVQTYKDTYRFLTYIHTYFHTYVHTYRFLTPVASSRRGQEGERRHQRNLRCGSHAHPAVPASDRPLNPRGTLSSLTLSPPSRSHVLRYTLHPTPYTLQLRAYRRHSTFSRVSRPFCSLHPTPCTLNQTLNPTGTAGAQPAREPQGHSAAGVGNEQPRRRTGAKG